MPRIQLRLEPKKGAVTLIEWRPQARKALRDIIDYLSDRNPQAAETLVWSIEKTAEGLARHPYLYRPGRVRGTREAVVHPNYLMVYRISNDRIVIIDVLHSRQEYPKD